MSYREIVTLQVGHYANHVGAHWWNLQEASFVYDLSQATGAKEICHDVLFREGLTRQREVTFTPRLVAFDLKGSLGTLRQDGQLYEAGQGEEEIRWPGDVTMHEEEPVPRNSFLAGLDTDNAQDEAGEADKEADDEKSGETEGVSKKRRSGESGSSNDPGVTSEARPGAGLQKKKLYNLDKSVYVWSDFLRTHLHPRSLHLVDEYRHNDELQSFDLYSCANEVLDAHESTSEWEDRIRRFAEECDALQGFHVLADMHDGFGGLSEGILKHLEDEYPGKGILTFGFTPSNLPDSTAKARATRIINSALAYSRLCDHSSLFVPASLASGLWPKVEAPVSMQGLSYQGSAAYHSSAILASSLDTVSLPYRLETGPINVTDITHSFNAQGRTVATLNTSMPLGLQHGESIVDFFCRNEESFPWQSLTPHIKNTNIPLMQSVVMRGVSKDLVKTQTDIRKLPDHMRGLNTRKEVLYEYLGQKCAGTLYAVNCPDSPVKTTIPFPHIFKEEVNKSGYLCDMPRPSDMGVESIPQLTSLQCNTEVGGVIKRLHGAAAKLNIKKHHRYLELGLEEDDYDESLDGLETLAGKYVTESEGL